MERLLTIHSSRWVDTGGRNDLVVSPFRVTQLAIRDLSIRKIHTRRFEISIDNEAQELAGNLLPNLQLPRTTTFVKEKKRFREDTKKYVSAGKAYMADDESITAEDRKKEIAKTLQRSMSDAIAVTDRNAAVRVALRKKLSYRAAGAAVTFSSLYLGFEKVYGSDYSPRLVFASAVGGAIGNLIFRKGKAVEIESVTQANRIYEEQRAKPDSIEINTEKMRDWTNAITFYVREKKR